MSKTQKLTIAINSFITLIAALINFYKVIQINEAFGLSISENLQLIICIIVLLACVNIYAISDMLKFKLKNIASSILILSFTTSLTVPISYTYNEILVGINYADSNLDLGLLIDAKLIYLFTSLIITIVINLTFTLLKYFMNKSHP